MPSAIRVRLNIPLIQCNLQSAGDPASEQDIRDWLRECGFVESKNDTWLCEWVSLESLDRAEWERV